MLSRENVLIFKKIYHFRDWSKNNSHRGSKLDFADGSGYHLSCEVRLRLAVVDTVLLWLKQTLIYVLTALPA